MVHHSAKSSIADLVDGPVDHLASGFVFAEGPIWHPTDEYLLFSDMPQDVRRRWDEQGGVAEVRRPSNKGNGMTYETSSALLVCEHATSSVVREQSDGRRELLASHWGGRELNSPNDIVVGCDGSIYFTDPIYGRLPEDGIERDQDLDFQGVYRIRPDGGLDLCVDDFDQPNGLCFSPDESVLYVNDTPRCHIRRFDVRPDGSLGGGGIFCGDIGNGEVGPTGVSDDGVPDGMKCDELGNIYCTGPDGIWVIDRAGERIGIIEVPEIVGNLNWGGSDWRTLYIAATTSIYRVPMNVAGRREPYMAAGGLVDDRDPQAKCPARDSVSPATPGHEAGFADV